MHVRAVGASAGETGYSRNTDVNRMQCCLYSTRRGGRMLLPIDWSFRVPPEDLSAMPTYVYEIINEDGSSGESFEVIQPISDAPLTEHPETGQPVRRVIQPPFIGGSWSESAMHKNVADDKKLDRLGFTKYVKSGDGVYEKRAGKGPDTISRDAPISGGDISHLD